MKQTLLLCLLLGLCGCRTTQPGFHPPEEEGTTVIDFTVHTVVCPKCEETFHLTTLEPNPDLSDFVCPSCSLAVTPLP